MAITLNEFKEAMESAGINPDIFSYTLIEDKDVEMLINEIGKPSYYQKKDREDELDDKN